MSEFTNDLGVSLPKNETRPQNLEPTPQETFGENMSRLTALAADPEKAALINMAMEGIIAKLETPEIESLQKAGAVQTEKSVTQEAPLEAASTMTGEDSPKEEDEVSSKPEEVVSPQEQLEQKMSETVEKGQELADQAFDVLGLAKLTGGERVVVDRSVIEDYIFNEGIVETFKVKDEIEEGRRDISRISEKSDYGNMLARYIKDNFKSLLLETKLGGKKLSGWSPDGEGMGHTQSIITPEGRKFLEGFNKIGPLIALNYETKDKVSKLLDTFEQFMGLMDKLTVLDNSTGRKIGGRSPEQVYNL